MRTRHRRATRYGRCGRDEATARPRIAAYLDLENLLYAHRARGDVDGVRHALHRILRDIARKGTIVAGVASCNESLARLLAFDLRPYNVRVHAHAGGPDAADLELIRRIRHELPQSCDSVVIGSGDHLFAEVAAEVRARGKRVELVAPERSVSWRLWIAADDSSLIATA